MTSSSPSSRTGDTSWDERVGHLLWDVSTRVGARAEAALAESPLSLSALGILDFVSAWPGITVAEISRQVPKTQQSISQVLSRLLKLGFIERRLRDGRGVGLYITPEGAAVHDVGQAQERELDHELRELLGARRYEQLQRLLAETRELLSD